MSIICAIHQPNFFPWLGYFDKIKKADIFVFLDNVQNQKTGGSWVNRVKLNCFGKTKWYTCPIRHYPGVVSINDVEFADSGWSTSLISVLENYYKKYSNCSSVLDLILKLIRKKDYCYIADLNKDIILYFANFLGCSARFISKKDLEIESHSVSMLIDICKTVGADTYLCGGGASDYQDDRLFSEAGINLIYQNFSPTLYGDPKKFLPGLSIIDYLMSI
ncbi:MAG: WbqC family protein [Coxiellaceae bacterium]|jgi:hypothetical protein|nr:WbqC family protein [Coxiellaceae bacterium]